MIDPRKIQRIRSLLAENKYSQRAIAKMLGVSRGTVNIVASGKKRVRKPRLLRSGENFDYPDGEPERCSECGAMTQMPCLACRIREMKRISEENTSA